MPKIPSLTAEKVIKILLKNGFVLDHQTGSHRVYYNKETKKRVVVYNSPLQKFGQKVKNDPYPVIPRP